MPVVIGAAEAVYRRLGARAARIMYDAQPEALINLGRLVTSFFTLLAVYLDPTQPAINVDETYEILGTYLVFSLSVVLLRSRLELDHPLHAVSTAIDISILAVLAIISERLESPFFIFFNFTLITAAIRWGWRGVLPAALVLQVQLLQIGVPDLEAGDYALNVLIIRSVYCWVAAVVLGYFASYRNRSEFRLSELADWPMEIMPEHDKPWLSSSLLHASTVLETQRIVVVWRDRDEQLAALAWWDGSECRFADGLPLTEEWAALAGEGGADRMTAASRRAMFEGLGTSVPSSFGQLQDWIRDPAHQSMHVTPFASIRYCGSLIVLDPARDESITTLMRIVASRVAMQLEQFSLARNYAAAAGFRERARLARDLHDSVLQDLTAAVLQLEVATRKLPLRWRPVVARVPELLKMQQRRIRSFVTEARSLQEDRPLLEQLRGIVEPLEAQWECRLKLAVRPPSLKVGQAVAAELCLAISEATANAVRHGAAREVEIAVQAEDGRLNMVIRNDGQRQGPASGAPPSSLTDRVHDLGGCLTVAADAPGYELTMELPLDQVAR